jgi:glycosyltransferase involved in cell wall biosynthesis
LVANSKYAHTRRWVDYFVGQGNEVHVISWGLGEIEGATIHYLLPMGSEDISDPLVSSTGAGKDRAKDCLRSVAHVRNLRQEMREASYKLDSFRLGLRCRRIIRTIKPDIVHGHGLVGNAFYAAMSGFRPLVLSAWGSDVLVNVPKSRFYRFLARYAVRKSDVVTADSAASEAMLHKMGVPREKVIVFPWGIDCKRFAPGYQREVAELRKELGIEDGAPVVLSPRSMTPLYNIRTLVDAMPEVVRRHPGVIFVLLRGYGTHEHEEALRNEVAKLGVVGHARFVSQLATQEEMAVLYNMADVLISIPHSDSMPVSLREGMACGCIPVVSDIEANRELIKNAENGFIVKEDGADLVGAIVYCLDNLTRLKAAMGNTNRRKIEQHHNWQETTRTMENIYVKLVESRRSGESSKRTL